jgi:hypothetical protein
MLGTQHFVVAFPFCLKCSPLIVLLKALLGSDILDGFENGVGSMSLFLMGIFSAILKAVDAADYSKTQVNYIVHFLFIRSLLLTFYLLFILVGLIALTTANNVQSSVQDSLI